MLEAVGNLFEMDCDAICITTNGVVKRNGEAVMGRGNAFEAACRFRGLAAVFGYQLQKQGNHCICLARPETYPEFGKYIFSFPTKHDWRDPSDLKLIEQSAHEMENLPDEDGTIQRILLPRPGCGNGGLDWETQVKPVIAPILDDRFTVVTY